jgi:hypothetical protein
MCGYKLDIDASGSPVKVDILSPEGTLIQSVEAESVSAAVEAAGPIIEADIAIFGCDAPWSV